MLDVKGIRTLIKFWQSHHGLKVDGIAGPETQRSMNTPAPKSLMNRIIRYALNDEGRGEQGGNNSGPWIRSLRRLCGFPADVTGPWCAVFISAKAVEASQSLDMICPFELSRGAYRLMQNIGTVGRYIDVPEPGFACWRRKGWFIRRSAHIRIITGYDDDSDTMFYAAGNEKGRVRVAALKNGAWRKGLLGMVTI